MNISTLALALVAALSVNAQTPLSMPYPELEDPTVNSINRLPARAYSMPLASAKAALTTALEPETPYTMSLNGDWKFNWVGDPARRPVDFYRTDFDDSLWQTIDVPSCVEMRGFGSPEYTNIRYPHAKARPNILDRDFMTADYNPVSSYRTTFTVPQDWNGRDVILRFDGVYSAYHVWVNGEMVGYAEDSKLPDEFDITPYLKDGENLLAVEVFRWCDGSYLEDQDMFRFSGIFRDVTLIGMPKKRIEDFFVRTSLDGAKAKIQLSVKSSAGAVKATLYDADNRKVAALSGAESAATLRNPHLWSAEAPYLYTLVIASGSDIRSTKVGIKEVRIDGGVFYLNGQPIKLKGVNRHEHSAVNGRTLTLAEMEEDIILMKRNNINTVRTCHYPDHHTWYDLCDRYGIYVVAEANVEGHEYGYDAEGFGLQPEWYSTIVERNVNHVLNYRNHGSIIFWSLGNETGPGPGFVQARDEIKALDPTRPVHYERQNADVDIFSRMYYGPDYALELKWNDDTKPYFMCEYAHAMGNSMGNFKEYWDAFYSSDRNMGGCIWDWVDQALDKPTGRLTADGKPEIVRAYGGDWDGLTNDGPFCCNGVIRPDRKPTAKLAEVRHVYRQIAVETKGNGVEVWNRFSFTPTSAFDALWSLLEDGTVVASGDWKLPSVAPGQKTTVPVPETGYQMQPGKEYFMNFSFTLKEDTSWAPQGHEIASDQVALKGNFWKRETGRIAHGAAQAIAVSEDSDLNTISFKTRRTEITFSKASGEISSLRIDGKQVIDTRFAEAGPQLGCMRAMVDNDCWLRDGWMRDNGQKVRYEAYGLTQLRHHGKFLGWEQSDNGSIVLKTCTDVAGYKSAGFDETTTWTINTDGTITMETCAAPYGHMPAALFRLGHTMILDGRLENVEYYGRGPEENYIDRNSGSLIGRYTNTVTGMYEDYIRPQDNGYRSDVRWIQLTDSEGSGVRFSGSAPLFVQALHYSWEDLAGSRHLNGQSRIDARRQPREEIFLNLDLRQLGLGGASCGEKPLPQYIFPIRTETWSITISPAE